MYYVYVHRKSTTGEIFYVGKGKGKRAWRIDNRSPMWEATYKKYGLVVEIVCSNLTEQQAFDIEKDFIEFYGRKIDGSGNLANISSGGPGIPGLPRKYREYSPKTGEDHPRYDKRLWTFINITTGETIVTTKYNATNKYPRINTGSLFNKKSSVDGWCVLEITPNDKLEAIKSGFSGIYCQAADKNTYSISNLLTGEVKSGILQLDMQKLGINSSSLVHEKILVSNWWAMTHIVDLFGIEELKDRYCNSGNYNPRADKTIYDLIHCKTMDKFSGTKSDFKKKFGFSINDIINRTDVKTIHGWALLSVFENEKCVEKSDSTTYVFEHEETCTIIESTRKEFKKITGIDCKNLFKSSRPYKHVKGWKLIK